jgi:hypothetical protein
MRQNIFQNSDSTISLLTVGAATPTLLQLGSSIGYLPPYTEQFIAELKLSAIEGFTWMDVGIPFMSHPHSNPSVFLSNQTA